MVSRNILDKAIETVSSNILELEKAADIDWDKYSSDVRARRFVERTLHVMIEACLDIAHHIISEKGFREPSTYRDSFTVLSENGILPPEDLPTFEKIAMFRNLIVHYYEMIDDAVVFGVFKKNLGDFSKFIRYILEYLERDQETGQ